MFAVVAVALAGCSASVTSGDATRGAGTTITIDPHHSTAAAVNPLLLGGNGHWLDDDFGGADPSTGQPYPAFLAALSRSGVTSQRWPAGTAANLYQWKRAIGPQDRRTSQVGLTDHGFSAPLDSTFGPDEYGQLTDRLGEPGDVLVNFSTATPTNAAEEVDYLTGRVGQEKIAGVDWAALRARNGHPAPYDIRYFEVGNEMNSGHQQYWRAGKSSENSTQLYTFGGSTTFTKQNAATVDDYRASAAVSTGRPGQHLQAQYPPVTPGSGRVFVGGTSWTQVSDLATARGTAHVYTIDDATGTITFGDGEHGAIPPKGARVTVSYTSGRHAGFTAFYAAMKGANPNVQVCAGLSDEQATEQFAKLMGRTHPYDCVQHHAYVNASKTTLPSSLSPSDYYERVLAAEPEQTGEVSAIKAAISRYAGAARAAKIGVVVTEYGNLGGHPKSDPTFHESLSEAILMGDDLISWIGQGVPEADKANLNGFGLGGQPPGEATTVHQNQDSMIQRVAGGRYVLTPTGLVPSVFRPLVGGTPEATTVSGNGTLSAAGRHTVHTLNTVAVHHPDGTVDLLVVNRDPGHPVTAHVDTGTSAGGSVRVSTLGGPSVTSVNIASAQTVRVTGSTAHVGSGRLEHTFPPHSITCLQFPG